MFNSWMMYNVAPPVMFVGLQILLTIIINRGPTFYLSWGDGHQSIEIFSCPLLTDLVKRDGSP